MMVMPAVDILDHNVVQLVGGVRGTEQLVMPNPVDVARDWVTKGAPMLHVVDLDGAFAKGNNIATIRRIISECGVPVEVGGGIRSIEVAEYLLDAGAKRVIVGTKAIREPEWLTHLAERNPNRIVLALDVKGGMITVKGWQESSGISHETCSNGSRKSRWRRSFTPTWTWRVRSRASTWKRWNPSFPDARMRSSLPAASPEWTTWPNWNA